jgi:hypothetical protein
LPADQLVQLFGCAIQAIEKRSLVTLSSITVSVVVDRALHESKENFPILSEITTGPKGLNLDALHEMGTHHTSEELREALRCLLVELLNVLGNITADILTIPLHRELMEVTCELALKVPELHVLRAQKSLKTNRGKS